ncbi:hypothetical protein ACE3NQ_16395 [Paenibacillus terreus]|uniref:Uncharacterized protein n=1 Tax=Paenibacillus terreus TaxID=1387834 RepID=A0ABV5B9Y2_9BACL
MNSQEERMEYLKRLRQIQIEVERVFTNMNKDEMGANDDHTEERELLDITFENELRLHSIYKQLNNLEKEVRGLASQVDNRGKDRKKPGPKPKRGIKRHYTVTMPQQDWDIIDNLIKEGRFRYVADYFRFLHRSFIKSQI